MRGKIWRPRSAGLAILGLLVASLTAGSPAAAAARPDLVVHKLTTSTDVRHAGQSLTISEQTFNKGAAKAGASVTRYVMSKDTKVSPDDVVLGQRSVAGQSPSHGASGSTKVTVPGSTAVGLYHVIACADAKHQVKESNETNQCAVDAFGLRITHPLDVNVQLSAVTASKIMSAGTLSVTDANGTQYTLAIPDGALVAPTTISMTPVDSISGGPLTTPLSAGVSVQPNGLRLLKTATLTITPTTPIPVTEQLGFASEGGGHEFHTYPLDPATGVIRFDLQHFSEFDLAPATGAERNAVQKRTPDDPTAATEADVAPDVTAARDGTLTVPLSERIVAHYELEFFWVVKPLMTKAIKNPGLGKEAIAAGLAWARSVMLYGLSDDPKSVWAQRVNWVNQAMITITVNDFNDQHQRCLTGDHPQQRLVNMLADARSLEIIGAASALGADYWSKVHQCSGDFQFAFDGTATRTPENDPSPFWYWSSVDAHATASGVPLRFTAPGDPNAVACSPSPCFYGRGAVTVSTVTHDTAGSCDPNKPDGGAHWYGLRPFPPPQPDPYVSVSWQPEINLGVVSTSVGLVGMSFFDDEQIYNRCNNANSTSDLRAFSDTFLNATVNDPKGNAFATPGGPYHREAHTFRAFNQTDFTLSVVPGTL